VFPVDASSIDKSLPVPVGTQLYGLLSYYLSHSDVPYGTKVQSVRQLAAELGIAPMTVSQVYQDLRDAGLIEMRRGLGAFSARDPHRSLSDQTAMTALRSEIDTIIGSAERLGISPSALASMITAQAQLRKPRSGLTIVFVGIFDGPTRDYVAQIRRSIGPDDQILQTTIEQLKRSAEARSTAARADLVLTFVHRETEVKRLVPDARTLAIRFIPSTRTRQALAGLSSRSRVAAVTFFQDYIAIMRPSVREFAPHISDVSVTWASAPDLADTLARCDAVIFATGADRVADAVRPGVPCIEFRHAPDPEALENLLVPYLAQLRRARTAGKTRRDAGDIPMPANTEARSARKAKSV
jgi:DNA-binding transcriptional regulator YhcF (GntR family)